jgi:16S rRNA (cytidine1402-2'-O)-methyltransferase
LKLLSSQISAGTLYVVATPIGNLFDMGQRAIAVLGGVDVIAAEDTRHTQKLLSHYGISAKLVSLHEHNERKRVGELIARLRNKDSIALVSDAGTPLVSDPGFLLVEQAVREELPVRAVPGPSAVVAALSVCGLPTDRFVFEGFLPTRSGPRRTHLSRCVNESRTLVFFEASRRLPSTLADMVSVFGSSREVSLVLEISKIYERISLAPVGELCRRLENGEWVCRGECVLIVSGVDHIEAIETDADRLVAALTPHLSPRRVAEVAAEIAGGGKNMFYRKALSSESSGRRD